MSNHLRADLPVAQGRGYMQPSVAIDALDLTDGEELELLSQLAKSGMERTYRGFPAGELLELGKQIRMHRRGY